MKIAITGAGIAGLTTAIALKQKGFEVVVFESAPAIKPIGAGISLSANAMKAFDRLGIKQAVAARGQFLDAFTILDEHGKVITRTDSMQMSREFGDDNFAIHRAELHEVLLSYLDPGELVLNKRVVQVADHGNEIGLTFTDGTICYFSCLVAADGIHSVIRKQLVPGSVPRYAGYTCWRGIIQNTSVKISEATETWGVRGRFGMVPLPGNLIYWFACINAPQNSEQMKRYKIEDLRKHFAGFHSPIPEILKVSETKNMIWNDIIDHNPINRYAYGNVVLIGDAAHATTPNMGQGACQAIEDAIVLADELSKNASAKQAFKQFEQRRIKRTHAIVNTSRMIGSMAQTASPLLAAIRNGIMRMMPSSFNKRQLKRLYTVDF